MGPQAVVPAQRFELLVADHDEQPERQVVLGGGERVAELVEQLGMAARRPAEGREDLVGLVEHGHDRTVVRAPVVPAQVGGDGQAGEPDRVLVRRPGGQQRERVRVAALGDDGRGHEGRRLHRAHGQHVEPRQVEPGQHPGRDERRLPDARRAVQDGEAMGLPAFGERADLVIPPVESGDVLAAEWLQPDERVQALAAGSHATLRRLVSGGPNNSFTVASPD